MNSVPIHIQKSKVIQKAINLFFLLFLLFGGILGGMVAIYYQAQWNTVLSDVKKGQEHAVDLQSKGIANEFDAIVGDLLFLSRQNELQEFLKTGDPAVLPAIAGEYAELARRKKDYDHIRFLDASGMEVVRVNDNDGAPAAVPSSGLQDKSGRYYFSETICLGADEVFVSPLDLNVENGRVEEPFKPMIRFGTPVFDDAGNKRGIILINYLARPLLSSIRRALDEDEARPMLLDQRGYWLLAADPDDEWGFMFDDRKDRSFPRVYPDEWAAIADEESGQLDTDSGLFTFLKVFPLLRGRASHNTLSCSDGGDATGYYWTLLTRIPPEVIGEYAFRLQGKLFILGAGLFVVISLAAWFLALAVTKRRIYQSQLITMALYDALTGLPNRKLFFDRLERGINHARRHERRLGLLYIDLDGFKEVNDTLGHEAGDELLVKVAEILLASTRKSDTVARLGGDEFAVILTEIGSREDARTAGDKIIEALSRSISLKGGEVGIGASIGAAVFPDVSEDADTLVKLADQAMYLSKANGKNLCTPAEPSPE